MDSEKVEFEPENIKLNQRHTKIIGTIQFNNGNKAYLKDLVKQGMDGIRLFCNDG